MGRFSRRTAEDEGQGATASELQVVRDVLLHSPARTTLTFGAPTRCPRCGDFGFVKLVEHGRGACHNHCFGCHLDWIVTARALEQQARIKAEIAVELADQLIPPPAIGRVMVSTSPSTAPDDDAIATSSASPVPEHLPPLVARPSTTSPAATPAPTMAASTAPEPVLSAIVERAMRDALEERRQREGQPSEDPSDPSDPAGPPATSVPADGADRPVRLLVVEDNPFDYAILEMIFDEAGPSVVDVTHVETFAEGFDHSNAAPFDVILLDLNLPDSSGVSTIESWQEANEARTPVIAMSSISDPGLPAAARDSGVAYFVRKTQIEELTYLERSGADRFVQLLQTTIRKGR